MKVGYWITALLGLILFLFAFPPLYLIMQELRIESKVQRDFDISRLSLLADNPQQLMVLGRGTPQLVNDVTVRIEVFTGSRPADKQHITGEEQYREWLVQQAQAGEKQVHYRRTYEWSGQQLIVEESFVPPASLTDNEQEWLAVSLQITVNGQHYSSEETVMMRPSHIEENRYHGYAGLLKVESQGEERLVWVQRTKDLDFADVNDLNWRMLDVYEDGQVEVHTYAYGIWGDAPERADMINQADASPMALGYQSNIRQMWPNLFFPFLYPYMTALIGLLLFVIGTVLIVLGFSRRRKA